MKKTKFTDIPVNSSALAERYAMPLDDLVKPPNKNTLNSVTTDFNKLREVVERYTAELDDVEAALQMLPDLNLVCETLNASILSPKDFREFKLNLVGESFTPPGIVEAMRRHFTTVYDLTEQVPVWLDLALCKRGSQVAIPISPKTISAMIKAASPGLEDHGLSDRLTRITAGNIGILGTGTQSVFGKVGTESHGQEYIPAQTPNPNNYIEITDNWMHALVPSLVDAYAEQRLVSTINSKYGIEEDVSNLLNHRRVLYKDRYVANLPTAIFSELSDADRDSNTQLNPIVLCPPASSVIPVHVPGEPKKHLGYYIPLDDDNNIIHLGASTSKYKELNNKLHSMISDQAASSLMSTGIRFVGTEQQQNANRGKLNKELLELHYAQIELSLCEAVSKGITGRKVEISNPGELYRISLFRQLQQQRTKILYIPASMVMYMAFNYTEDGVGEALLVKTKLYSSFRIVLTFATVVAAVRGSVNTRTVDIMVDDNDPDPRGTAEMLINEYMGLQTSSIPIASLRPVDIIDGLAKSGVQVRVKGSPDRIPQTSMDVEDKKREITPPDKDVMEWLKDAQYAGCMVSPEIMDRVLGAELAVSVATVSLLQAKRVMKIHKPLIKNVNWFMHTYAKCGGPLYEELKQLYKDSNCEKTLHEVIESVSMSLPQPDTAVITTQIEAFDKYYEFVEKVVKVSISEDMISSLLKGEFTNVSVGSVTEGIINLIMRDYIKQENLIPELEALLNDEDSNLGELVKQHYDRVIVLVQEIARTVAKSEHDEDEVTNKFIEKYAPQDQNDGGEENTEEGGEQSDEGDGDDEGGMNDDFGGEGGSDDDFGDFDEPVQNGDGAAPSDTGEETEDNEDVPVDDVKPVEPNTDDETGEPKDDAMPSEDDAPSEPDDTPDEKSKDEEAPPEKDVKKEPPKKEPASPPPPKQKTTKYTDQEDKSKIKKDPEPKAEKEPLGEEEDVADKETKNDETDNTDDETDSKAKDDETEDESSDDTSKDGDKENKKK